MEMLLEMSGFWQMCHSKHIFVTVSRWVLVAYGEGNCRNYHYKWGVTLSGVTKRGGTTCRPYSFIPRLQ